MSGIFKSVKKAFKSIGKVVKKVLPVLVIAAAVYFGGSYLMSLGAPSAGAAMSTAKSVSKSAGVWKSFLGGLGSGTASSSAAAFAEASYQAMGTLPVSGQVAAGTAAVNALGTGMKVGEAITFGVKAAETAWGSGSTQSAWQSLIGGFGATPDAVANVASQTQLPASGNLVKSVTGEVAPSSMGTETLATPTAASSAATQGIDFSQGWGADSLMSLPGHTSAVSAPATDFISASAQGQGYLDSLRTQSTGLFDVMLENIKQGSEEAAKRHTERMAAMKMGWAIQGGGLIMSGLGAYASARDKEKELERTRNWKPTGTERYSDGRLMYPDGLIT